MTDAGHRIAGLERQVADLTARVEQLAQEAFMLKALNRMSLEILGHGIGDCAALKLSRPRHLTAVQGGPR